MGPEATGNVNSILTRQPCARNIEPETKVFDSNTGGSSGGTGASPVQLGRVARLFHQQALGANRWVMYNRGLNFAPPTGNNTGRTCVLLTSG